MNPLPPSLTQAKESSSMSFYSNTLVSGADKKDPKKIAGMFEAMLYRMMLQEIRSTEEEDPIFGSTQMEQVKGMYDDELSLHLGQQGHLGMQEMISSTIEQAKKSSPSLPSFGLLKPPTTKECGV